MDFNAATIWSFIATLCFLALLVEGVTIFRILFITRQPLRRYFVLLIPLIVSTWSFGVLWSALNVFASLPTYHGTHMSFAFYHTIMRLSDQAITACQVQSGIALAVFIALIFIERKILPHVERTPAWVLARKQTIRRREDLWQGIGTQSRTRMPLHLD